VQFCGSLPHAHRTWRLRSWCGAARLLVPASACRMALAAWMGLGYLEPRTKMMQDWADLLDRTRQGGKVIMMRESA
jgi:hypothetical protein